MRRMAPRQVEQAVGLENVERAAALLKVKPDKSAIVMPLINVKRATAIIPTAGSMQAMPVHFLIAGWQSAIHRK